MNIKNQLRQ